MKKNIVTAGELSASIKHKYERMTFFGSFKDAIDTLGPRNKLLAYEVLSEYGLDNIRRENLPKDVEAIIRMAIPQINASHRRYREGMKGKPYGNLGAKDGVNGGRPAKEGEIVELNEDGKIDQSNL